jgi:hypothetical protein
MHQIHVEVQNVEPFRTAPYLIQHHQNVRKRVSNCGVQAQCPRATGHQLSPRARVAGAKHRNLVTLADQFLCQIRHHALGSAIQPRGHRLGERGDLCDPHPGSPCVARQDA